AGQPVGGACGLPGGIGTGFSRQGRKSARLDAAALDARVENKLARMSPEKAARIILKGVTGDKARVVVGFDAHAIHTFAKLAGSRYQDLFARASKRIAPPRR
ncbi:MAG: acetoin dehydrogenase, partial [Nocardioides sp.]